MRGERSGKDCARGEYPAARVKESFSVPRPLHRLAAPRRRPKGMPLGFADETRLFDSRPHAEPPLPCRRKDLRRRGECIRYERLGSSNEFERKVGCRAKPIKIQRNTPLKGFSMVTSVNEWT